MDDLATAVREWREQLVAWAIPAEIRSGASDSPWVLPTGVLTRRTDRYVVAPIGPSFRRAADALDPPGSVLDVGAGAGAAGLPLAARAKRLGAYATEVTAVDVHPGLLDAFTARARRIGAPARTVLGSWPEAAGEVAPADVVVCHNVLYDAPELGDFVDALHRHARRRVVIEMTEHHPLLPLNPLWKTLHGVDRPNGPSATDAIAVIRALGLSPRYERWRRPDLGLADPTELVDVTRRRLCLPPERLPELLTALDDLGIDPTHPWNLGSADNDLVTIWWDA